MFQGKAESASSMIVPVWVSTQIEPERQYLVYALLDTQSDTTFILDQTAKDLNAQAVDVALKLTTMTSRDELVHCKKYSDIVVRGFDLDTRIHLPSVYSRDFIPVDRSHIPTAETAKKWPHLASLSDKVPPLQDCDIGLLIGYNCPQALAPRGCITGEDNQPFAIQTVLGWSVVGCIDAVEASGDIICVSHKVITTRVSDECANFGLKNIANENESEFRKEAADFVRQNFYVDDGLKSVETAQDAIALVDNARKMCAKAGLRLHKFVSNNHEVTESIPKSSKAKNVKSQDLSFEDLPVERALGIEWSIESDEFQFRLALKDRPLTRRGVLSTVASPFDPIGFLAPYVLVGKQEMCRDGADWDDPLPEPLCQKWESEIPDEDGVKDLSPDDPEVKTVHVKTTQVDTKNLLLDRMDRFSDWSRATRAVAVLRQAIAGKRQEGRVHKA